MKKNQYTTFILILGIVIFLLAGKGEAQTHRGFKPVYSAENLTEGGGVGGSGGGGGELPTPFDTANRKVELADNEAYILTGWVILLHTELEAGQTTVAPYFKVDLAEHPWLASEKRVSQPYYPLAGAIEEWRDYVKAGKVKLPCIARSLIKLTGSSPSHVVQLQMSKEFPIEPIHKIPAPRQ